MKFRKQRREQVDMKFDTHKLPKINGKRKAGGQIRSDYEGDFLKTEADAHKRRAIQGLHYQVAATKTSLPVLEKVDTFALPRKYVGEEFVYLSSFEDRINQSFEETEGSQCSVASSSSIYVSNYKVHSHKKFSNRPVVNSPFDDAQSSCECPSGRKTESLTEKNVAVKVHNLELWAYCKMMRAFYASGCLTWEQEALLTDLRLSLHISHDEHLSELTCLRLEQAV